MCEKRKKAVMCADGFARRTVCTKYAPICFGHSSGDCNDISNVGNGILSARDYARK